MNAIRAKTAMIIGTASLWLAGCPQKKADETADKSAAVKPATPPAAKGKAPAPKLAKPVPEIYYSGAHILVAYKGARRAKPSITRSKKEAAAEAAKLAKSLREDSSKFAAVAKERSDGPSGPTGGDLGTWRKGQMVPAFDAAIEKLKPGGVSDPVETPFGYHVIMRKEVLPEVKLAAQQLLITFEGTPTAKMMARNKKKKALKKAAAKKLAEKLAKQAANAPDKFEELVKKHSDDPSAARGGSLGMWSSRKSRMPPVFTNTVRGLKVGGVSGVVESPYGFHIFKRTAPPPIYAGSHVLISYKGASRANAKVTRTKVEAQKLAMDLSTKLQADASKFVEMAAKHSDGPSASRGGRLGKWPKGRMVPAFDAAIDKLKIGEVSKPVETPFGFHVILREDPAKVTR